MVKILLSVIVASWLSAQTVPQSLASETWKRHLVHDILPFWTTEAALGSPRGWYPTVRNNRGEIVAGRTDRRPRMMGRQIFLYCVGFLMTGQDELLEFARLGVRQLIDRAWDREFGGWHELLSIEGTPNRGPKWAQDSAYAAQGLAAYYFVTRDPEALEFLEKTRALIMDPRYYWDAENQRVRDGLTHDLTRERDQEMGGWELVAALDQINAYMVLTTSVLSEPTLRAQWKEDLERLSDSILTHFWQEGVFFGQSARVGIFWGRHTDLGHNIKSHWMIGLVGRILEKESWTRFSRWSGQPWIEPAFDSETGIWGNRLNGWREIGRGSNWWIYAEMDQFTAEMNLLSKGEFTYIIQRTAENWLNHFVDRVYGEVFPEIGSNGRPRSYAPEGVDKVWDWKNGFHSAEHALIMYLHGKALEQGVAELYFAFSNQDIQALAKPYLWNGREVGRRTLDTVRYGGQERLKVVVSWSEIKP